MGIVRFSTILIFKSEINFYCMLHINLFILNKNFKNFNNLIHTRINFLN